MAGRRKFWNADDRSMEGIAMTEFKIWLVSGWLHFAIGFVIGWIIFKRPEWVGAAYQWAKHKIGFA